MVYVSRVGRVWMCCVAMFGLVLADLCPAELVMDMPGDASYVEATQVGQGYAGGEVPWSLVSPRSPAAGYTGPVYYGGAKGNTAIGAGAFLFANSVVDYITVQASAGTVGDWVVLVPMFNLSDSFSLTNITFTPRLTGSALQQTNYTRLVIQQNGGLYASGTNWYFNSNAQTLDQGALDALSWYAYDPTVDMQGSTAPAAPGIQPTNVTAVGILFYNENTTSRTASVGMSAFRAWGTAVGTETNYPSGDFTLEVISAYGTPDPAAGVYTNAGGTVLTNSASSPAPSGGTQLVVNGWTMTGHAPATGGSSSFTMTVTNDAVLTWWWATNVEFASAAASGGTIAGDPPGYYALGGSVTVTGVPGGGYDFAGWSGDVSPAQTNDNPLTLTLDRTRAVIANFVTNGGPVGPLQLPSLSNAPVSARFVLSTNRVWPAVAGDPHVCLWDGDRFAALSITIDDNHPPDHTWWLQRGIETGFSFTWFVISGRVGGNGGTWPGFQILEDAGHAIDSHTHSHLTDITNDWPGIEWDYAASQTNIQANLVGPAADFLSYPGGYKNPTLPYSTNNDRVAAAAYYGAVRGTVGTPNKANQIDYFNINSVGTGTGRGYSDAILYGTSSIAWLNNSQYLRGWLCTHFHNVTNVPALAPVWAADMAYLATVTNDLWVGRFDDVAKYGQERDTATVTILTNSERVSKFVLSDDMLDTRFNYPLTLKIRLYPSWTNPIALQGGAPVPLQVVTTNGATYALIRAVPDQGTVIVVDRTTDGDEDGVADWQEAFAGSNPDDPDSFPRLTTELVAGTGERVFQWDSVAPLTYSLRYASNLTDGFTELLLTNIPATPPVNTVTAAPPPEAAVYYQLLAE